MISYLCESTSFSVLKGQVCEAPEGQASQRQRIGIARALYHDPDLLILDEVTSALDNLTEQTVMEAVHNLGNKKTITMIAHRLTTVQECDEIFLLEHGKLVSSGTFSELKKKERAFPRHGW